MKLEKWVDGSLEIMHIFFFSSYVENSVCFDNKYTKNMANFTDKLYPVILKKYWKYFYET
jgi:hypothetical protein